MKSIEVVFENVESIIISADRIKEFRYGNLKSLNESPQFFGENEYISDYISFSISYEKEEELDYNSEDYVEPLGMFTNNPSSNRVADRPNILGRILTHSDIVCLQELDENEKAIRTIYVPWDDDNGFSNKWMNSKKEQGLLIVEIKED